jgi:hypothetical protein
MDNETSVEHTYAKTLEMSLTDISTPEDINLWRNHNHAVAEYLANFVRQEMFAPGTQLRNDYLNGIDHTPEEIKNAIKVVGTIKIDEARLPARESINIDLRELGGNEPADITHSPLEQLQALANNEEMHTQIIHYLADMLGVPMVNIYTGNLEYGHGGHAMALIRAPYQENHSSWVFDVMDPLSLVPTLGIPLKAHSREDAFAELGSIGRGNTIGIHYLEEKVDFNLFERIGPSGIEQLFEVLRQAGVAKLQENEYVNCQFMSLLIQAYLWRYYGSTSQKQDAGGLANIPLGDIINQQFEQYFNASIKSTFDIISQVQLQEVPADFTL